MLEQFANQLLTEAGLIAGGLLLGLLFMARTWQKEREANKELQAQLLALTRESIAAEKESAEGLRELRRLTDSSREMRHVMGDVSRHLEDARQWRVNRTTS